MEIKLLIFGNGQIGSELIRLVPDEWITKVVTRQELDFYSDQARIFQIIEELKPNIVVNAVAYTKVDQAETDCKAAFMVNAMAPKILAEACSKHSILLIHFSTDYVFDGKKDGLYTEKDTVNPIGIYGKSKAEGEYFIKSIAKKYIILRTSWVYSSYGNNFVKTMLRLANNNSIIEIIDDQHGSPTYAKDLAELVIRIINRYYYNQIPDNGFGIFHCTNQGYTTWYQFAKEIFLLAKNYAMNIDVSILKAITSERYNLNNKGKVIAKRPLNSKLSCKLLEGIYGEKLRMWQEALNEMLIYLHK